MRKSRCRRGVGISPALRNRDGLIQNSPAVLYGDVGIDADWVPYDYLVVQDWKGNICEISDEFDVTYLRNAIDFVTRRWIKCPVENRNDWEQMKSRYNAADFGRFPEDFEDRCRLAARRDDVLTIASSGPFWQMREWCGFEGPCMLMVEDPELIEEMAAFWTDFVAEMLERILTHVVFDVLSISEDMAYKEKAMISPPMIRTFCRPSWDRWCRLVHGAGVPLVDMDSDGYVGEILPIWIESGISVCDPMEAAAGNDLQTYPGPILWSTAGCWPT